MAINIKMTPIHHDARLRLGLDLVEYTVAHVIHFSSINPKAPIPGWCSYSKKTIGDFVGVSERKVFTIINKLEGASLVERHPEQGFTKTTGVWFEATMTDANFAGGMQDLQGDPAEFAGGGMQDLQTSSNTTNKGNKNPLAPTGGQGALFGEAEKPQGEKAPPIGGAEEYRDFVGHLNNILDKAYRGDSKSRSKFAARRKEGYTMEEIRAAVNAASVDDFHRGNGFKYLTPEYITREDQLQKWLNARRASARASRPASSEDASAEERARRMRQMGITH